MGLLTDHDKPAVLRGPMVLKYLHVFLQQVAWGELDWLVMDLPPGTGDVQLTLAQGVPLDGAVIVTTPQDVSLDIARRGLRMFETVKVPLLGIVENMSGFTCPHCGEVTPVFKQGGGSTLAADTSVPLLGSIPLDPEVMAGGDAGTPIVVAKPASPTAVAFRDIARAVAGRVGDVATAALGAFNWKWDREGPGWNEAATKRDGRPGVPVGLSRANPRTLGILWEDGARTEHDVRELRLACECAQCREEMTGRVTLDPSRVPLDVAPRSISSVGSYAIAVAWSDGHNSGIYAFERLRALGDARAPAHEV
jgi:ATP-binding protein involved in chromosome partitioning